MCCVTIYMLEPIGGCGNFEMLAHHSMGWDLVCNSDSFESLLPAITLYIN